MGDQTVTMRDLSTAVEIAQKFGISATGVKNMAQHHVFEAVSIGNSVMFTNRSVEALGSRTLAAFDPKQQMTAPEVAILAGLKCGSLDYYIRLGKLKTVQIAPAVNADSYAQKSKNGGVHSTRLDAYPAEESKQLWVVGPEI